MIFIKDRGKRFGYINKLFLNNKAYTSLSIISSFVNSGYMGPTNCGGISTNKNLSQIKAFSESIERRAMALVKEDIKENPKYIQAFDLIQKKSKLILESRTKYSLKKPYVDTTGTAAHINGEGAIFNAVSELLEKNAVFLFWYGNQTKRIDIEIKSFYKDYLEFQGYKIFYFVIDEFYPLLIVITTAISINNTLKFKYGVGSSMSLYKAISKSLSEAYLLGSYYEIKYYDKIMGLNEPDEELDKFADEEVFNHLIKLSKAPLFSIHEKVINDKQKLYENLPPWIQELLITILPQSINRNLIVVKALSNELYSHIPNKEYIDLNKSINQSTIDLTKDQLRAIPNCPIV